MIYQILIGRFIRYHVDRIGQNTFDGKTGEVLAAPGLVPALQQKLIGLRQGACFKNLRKISLTRSISSGTIFNLQDFRTFPSTVTLR